MLTVVILFLIDLNQRNKLQLNYLRYVSFGFLLPDRYFFLNHLIIFI